MSTWREAAGRYREQKVEEKSAAMRREATAELEQRKAEQKEQDIRRIADELEAFLNSEEGRDALALFKASDRTIVCARERDGQYAEFHLLTGEGCMSGTEAAGDWVAYAQQVPEATVHSCSALELVTAASHHGRNKNPNTLMQWLRDEIDKIAAAAPEPKS